MLSRSSSTATTPKRTRSPLCKSNRTPKTPRNGDRFIPSRSAMDVSASHFNLTKEDELTANGLSFDLTAAQEDYAQVLKESLFQEPHHDGKILAFKNKAPQSHGNHSMHRVLYSAQSTLGSKSSIANDGKKVTRRHIPSTPYRILDAPDILDDYYLNLLDWGSNNQLAVALGRSVYLWNASSGDINLLTEMPEESSYVASVKWMHDGSYLAIGTSEGFTQIWDSTACKQVRNMNGHLRRVTSLSWNPTNLGILSSGSQDSVVVNHDVRIQNHQVSHFAGHSMEVCGLEWSQDGTQLASGSNDNLLCIWNLGSQSAQHTIRHHTAAVKALAWCPHRPNLLASGAGSADRRICFWNSTTGACVKEVDTKSQVCSIRWSKNHKDELISSHGYSNNQLTVWKYPRMTRVAELTGHTSRVLYLAESPDGETIVSAAGDETLRFWKAFEKTESVCPRAKQEKVTSTHIGGIRAVSLR